MNTPAPLIHAPALAKPFTVAVITNVYNERHNLPVWLGHYGRQVGSAQCIVLDHGSNDGSTDDLKGAGVIRLARGESYNERHRMTLITNLANSLLGYYDAVIYTDCDEMVVADPAKYENLVDYARQHDRPASFCIGFNLRHDPDSQPPLQDDAPVLMQRPLAQFVSAMCKPLLIRKPVSWGGGFHCCQHKPVFDDLYLFHLRHADMTRSLERLKVTRQIKFAREGGGKHQRRDDAEAMKIFENVKKIPVEESFDMEPHLTKHLSFIGKSFSGRYSVQKGSIGTMARYLNRIPERFRSVV